MTETTLLCGDCLEMMEHIPDGGVDMVLTDPPYSSGGLYAGERQANTRTKYCERCIPVPGFQRR